MNSPNSARIAAELRARIEGGRQPDAPPDAHPPFKKLPSVRHLEDTLGIGKQTASDAYDLLARAGLVLRKAGADTMVAPPIPVRTARHTRVADRNTDDLATLFVRDMASAGWVGETTYTYVGEAPVPDWAAHLLDGPTAWARKRVLKATPLRDGEPETAFAVIPGLHDSYYPAQLLEAVPSLNMPGSTGVGGAFSRFTEAGIVLDPLLETTFTRLPTDEEVQLMGIPHNWMVCVMVRRISSAGVVIGAEIEVTRPEWVVREYEIPAA